jgi:hypothetical protein
MLDVPVRRAGEIEARLRELHPEARMEGAEVGVPVFR